MRRARLAVWMALALAGAMALPASAPLAQTTTPAAPAPTPTPTPAPTPTPDPDPLELVRGLYRQPQARPPLSQRLAALQEGAQANARKINAPVAGLDFAYEWSAQEAEPGFDRTLRITLVRIEGQRAIVRAAFRNFRPVVLIYEFLRENDRWTLDEVRAVRGPRWTLSALYAKGARER